MKKLISLIFICFFLCDVAFATPGDLCSDDCKAACPSSEKIEGRDNLNDLTVNPVVKRICDTAENLLDNTNAGFGNALIGWGKSCTIPGGEQAPFQYSCISTGNVMGQILDTFTTLGIATTMRNNFCSFSPGIDSTGNSIEYGKLEGAIVSRSIFQNNNCAKLNGIAAHNCTSCILKGKLPADSGTGCKEPKNSNDPLGMDQYTRNTNLCDGIPNLERPLIGSDGIQVYKTVGNNSIPVYCPITRCNIPTNHIMTKYHDPKGGRADILKYFGAFGVLLIAASELTGDCCDIERLEPNQRKDVAWLGFVTLRGKLQGDRMCAQMRFTTGYTTLACKPSIPPEIIVPDNACFMQNINATGFKSKWVFPITSQLVQIITEVFDTLFKESKCQSGLTTFQNNMKSIVSILLILYVMFFGFNVVIGNGRIGKKDIFMFLLKFGLVVYFAVGTFNVGTDSSNSGLIWLRNSLTSATTSLSNMIVTAANSKNPNGSGVKSKICDFSQVQYDKGYEYLRMWDTLDCKLSFYLGLSSPTEGGLIMHKVGTVSSNVAAGIFNLLWGLTFSGNFLIVLFLFAFGIFLLSLVVYFTHLYIIAMVAIAIMIFFGPIFVPMALFDRTKEYFDSWIRLLLGYALQPVVVVAVLSVMIATFDSIIYSDCNFTQKSVSDGQPYWILEGEEQSAVCQNTLGYNLASLTSGKHVKETSANSDTGNSLFKYNVTTNDLLVDLLEGLMLCTFFAFLFYFFSSQIGVLAQELTGAPSLAPQAIGPTAVMDTLARAVPTEGKAKPAKLRDIEEEGVNVSGKTKEGEGVDVSSKTKEGEPEVSAGGSSTEEEKGVDVSDRKGIT